TASRSLGRSGPSTHRTSTLSPSASTVDWANLSAMRTTGRPDAVTVGTPRCQFGHGQSRPPARTRHQWPGWPRAHTVAAITPAGAAPAPTIGRSTMARLPRVTSGPDRSPAPRVHVGPPARGRVAAAAYLRAHLYGAAVGRT